MQKKEIEINLGDVIVDIGMELDNYELPQILHLITDNPDLGNKAFEAANDCVLMTNDFVESLLISSGMTSRAYAPDEATGKDPSYTYHSNSERLVFSVLIRLYTLIKAIENLEYFIQEINKHNPDSAQELKGFIESIIRSPPTTKT